MKKWALYTLICKKNRRESVSYTHLIAPFYSDKYAKIGFQVSELFDDELLKEKVVRVAEQKNVLLEHLYHKPAISPEDLYKDCLLYTSRCV